MALSKSTSLTSTIDDDFLTCKLCFKFYQQPKILPCTHTYCTPCIEELLAKSDDPCSILCPECGERTALPHGAVSDLKTNNIITSVTNILTENGETRKECSACRLRRKFSPDNSRQDCGDYFCLSCSNGHIVSSMTWNHEVFLEDVKEEACKQEMNSQSPACPEHDDEEMDYFCETCKIPVCATCVMLSHHDHECVTSTEVINLRKNIIMNATQKIRGKLQVLKNRENLVSSKLSSIENTKVEIKQKIDDHTSRQISMLEKHREKALKAVDDRAMKSERKFDSLLSSIKNKLSLTSNCLELFDTLVEQCENDDFLQLDSLATAYQRLEELSLTDTSCNRHDDIPATNTEQICDNNNTKAMRPEPNDANETPVTQRDETKPKISIEHLETLGETPHGTDCRFSSADFYGLLDIERIEMPHQTILMADKDHGKLVDIFDSGYATANAAECCFPFHISLCGTIVDYVSHNKRHAFQDPTCTHRLSDDDLPHAIASYRNNGYIVGHQRSNELLVYDTKGNLQSRFSVPISYPLANISVDHSENITTCEWGNNSVRVLSHQDGAVKVITEILSIKAHAACVDGNGLLYTVEKSENRLSVFDKSGSCVLQYITTHCGLENPVGLAFDNKEGLMYVVSEDDVVHVYRIICARV